MSITNSIKHALPGFGVPGLGNASGTSSTISTNVVTANAALPSGQTINYGLVRVKVSGIDATHAIASWVISMTDGTTTEYLDVGSVTGTNAQGMEKALSMASDLAINKVTAAVTFATGVTAATVDVEVFGN